MKYVGKKFKYFLRTIYLWDLLYIIALVNLLLFSIAQLSIKAVFGIMTLSFLLLFASSPSVGQFLRENKFSYIYILSINIILLLFSLFLTAFLLILLEIFLLIDSCSIEGFFVLSAIIMICLNWISFRLFLLTGESPNSIRVAIENFTDISNFSTKITNFWESIKKNKVILILFLLHLIVHLIPILISFFPFSWDVWIHLNTVEKILRNDYHYRTIIFQDYYGDVERYPWVGFHFLLSFFLYFSEIDISFFIATISPILISSIIFFSIADFYSLMGFNGNSRIIPMFLFIMLEFTITEFSKFRPALIGFILFFFFVNMLIKFFKNTSIERNSKRYKEDIITIILLILTSFAISILYGPIMIILMIVITSFIPYFGDVPRKEYGLIIISHGFLSYYSIIINYINIPKSLLSFLASIIPIISSSNYFWFILGLGGIIAWISFSLILIIKFSSYQLSLKSEKEDIIFIRKKTASTKEIHFFVFNLILIIIGIFLLPIIEKKLAFNIVLANPFPVQLLIHFPKAILLSSCFAIILSHFRTIFRTIDSQARLIRFILCFIILFIPLIIIGLYVSILSFNRMYIYLFLFINILSSIFLIGVLRKTELFIRKNSYPIDLLKRGLRFFTHKQSQKLLFSFLLSVIFIFSYISSALNEAYLKPGRYWEYVFQEETEVVEWFSNQEVNRSILIMPLGTYNYVRWYFDNEGGVLGNKWNSFQTVFFTNISDLTTKNIQYILNKTIQEEYKYTSVIFNRFWLLFSDKFCRMYYPYSGNLWVKLPQTRLESLVQLYEYSKFNDIYIFKINVPKLNLTFLGA